MPTFSYLYNGTPIQITLDSSGTNTYQATVGDRVILFSVGSNADGSLTLTLENGDRSIVRAAAEDNLRYAAVDGEAFSFTLPTTLGGRASRRSAGGDALIAQMPGQVREVLVSEGATVTRGQALIVLEAMKMEIRISAPADGVVKRVRVSKGDVVERGQQLIEMG